MCPLRPEENTLSNDDFNVLLNSKVTKSDGIFLQIRVLNQESLEVTGMTAIT